MFNWNMLLQRSYLFQGRNFSGIIQSFVNNCKFLNEEALPAFSTLEGKKAYEDTLNCLKNNFPQYVKELEGTADGADVSFHKVKRFTSLLYTQHFANNLFRIYNTVRNTFEIAFTTFISSLRFTNANAYAFCQW